MTATPPKEPPTTPEGYGALLRGAFASWRTASLASHAAALAVVTAVLVVRFHAAVLSPVPVEDERVYFGAFEKAAQGESPYGGFYFYTPTFALAGAWSVEHFGEAAVLAAMRTANLLGMAWIAWLSGAWLPWTWRRRLLAASAYVAVAPAVRLGAAWGNLSLLVVGLLLAALLVWPRRPVAAGLLLAASLVIKPLGPVVAVALAAHRPANGGRRHLVAGFLGLALAAALVLPMPWLQDMLAFGGKPENGRNVALQHLLYCFGLRLGTVMVAAAVAVATLVAGRRRRWPRESLLGFAGVAGVLALPVVWSHTLLLVLPLEVMALTVAFARRAAPGAGTSALRRYEAAFVVLAVLAVQLCEGLGGIETWPLLVQGVATLLPALAPAALLGYLLRTTSGV